MNQMSNILIVEAFPLALTKIYLSTLVDEFGLQSQSSIDKA
jgi:hypothetical protein